MENQIFAPEHFENGASENAENQTGKPKKTRAEILYEKKLKIEKENERLEAAIREVEKKEKQREEKKLIEMIKKSVGKHWFDVFKTVNMNSEIEIFIDGKSIREIKK